MKLTIEELLPEPEAIRVMPPRVQQDALLAIPNMLMGLIQTAHRDDHRVEPDGRGGEHDRTRSVIEAADKALLLRYGNSPAILARIITTACMDSAFEDSELEGHR